MLYVLLAVLIGCMLVVLSVLMAKRRHSQDVQEESKIPVTQTILDAISLPVMMIDRNFNILFLNTAGAALGGKDASAYIGTKCHDLFRTGHCNTDACALAQVMKHGRSMTARTVSRPREGVAIPILYSGSPYRDASGRIVGAIEHVLDITHIHQTQEAVTSGCHDLAEASGALEGITDAVSHRTRDMTDRVHSVAAGAKQMSGNFNSVSAAVEQIHGIFNSLASSADEMSATIEDITRTTSEANSRTILAVGQSMEMEKRVQALNQASGEIGGIVNTIIGIAEQTKLLALNASIEAARAGDSGKGFAVVAGEVKDLARQTTESISDIQLKVASIQETSASTAEDIVGITSLINEISSTITSVAGSMEEQTVTTREIARDINTAVSGLNDVTQNISQANSAAKDIAQGIGFVQRDMLDVGQRMDEAAKRTLALGGLGRNLTEAAQALNR